MGLLRTTKQRKGNDPSGTEISLMSYRQWPRGQRSSTRGGYNSQSKYVHKKIKVWDLEIPVQVPAIKTCFMSTDEIARIFSKSQSLCRGGEFGKAFIGTQKELEILLSPYRAL